MPFLYSRGYLALHPLLGVWEGPSPFLYPLHIGEFSPPPLFGGEGERFPIHPTRCGWVGGALVCA